MDTIKEHISNSVNAAHKQNGEINLNALIDHLLQEDWTRGQNGIVGIAGTEHIVQHSKGLQKQVGWKSSLTWFAGDAAPFCMRVLHHSPAEQELAGLGSIARTG